MRGLKTGAQSVPNHPESSSVKIPSRQANAIFTRIVFLSEAQHTRHLPLADFERIAAMLARSADVTHFYIIDEADLVAQFTQSEAQVCLLAIEKESGIETT